jgi:hypothetical protein
MRTFLVDVPIYILSQPVEFRNPSLLYRYMIPTIAVLFETLERFVLSSLFFTPG